MIIISRIIIENFRSLRKVDIKVGGLNVFSGLNDVGKSNVLKALNLFFNSQTDFASPPVFSQDFSKIALASAQRARRQKQQIKIKIFFTPPKNLKALHGLNDLSIEKVFYKEGEPQTNYYPLTLNKQQRSGLTRLINKISYFYIPALKGPEVFRSLLAEIGKYQLIPADQIKDLNKTVNEQLGDLQGILGNSQINTQTTVGLPVLLEDFWQRLKINTKYDAFDDLQARTRTTKMGNNDPLKEEFYQVPLELRGEGVKSKFIPPLLKWMQAHSNNIFIWGIDEPENSLEFRKAEELSKLYFEEYSKNTQLFLVSHSLAFIFPKTTSGLTTFRCTRGNIGQTEITPLDDLLAHQSKEELADEIGALEIQKEKYKEWREEQEKYQNLIANYKLNTGPILYVEGPNDKRVLEIAWNALYQEKPQPFIIQECGGAPYLMKFLKNPGLHAHQRVMIGLFDCDNQGYSQFKSLFTAKGHGFSKVSAEEVQDSKHNIFALVIPTPTHRTIYTETASEDPQLQFLEIEHYFEDTLLDSSGVVERTTSSGIRKLNKNREPLYRILSTQDRIAFRHFEPLFDKLITYMPAN